MFKDITLVVVMIISFAVGSVTGHYQGKASTYELMFKPSPMMDDLAKIVCKGDNC